MRSGAARAAVLGDPREKVSTVYEGSAPPRVPSHCRALGHLTWAEAPGTARGGTGSPIPAARSAAVYAALPVTVLPEESGSRPVPASAPASPGGHRVARPWSKQQQLLNRAQGPANAFPSNPALPPPANGRRGRRAPLPRHVIRPAQPLVPPRDAFGQRVPAASPPRARWALGSLGHSRVWLFR